MSFAVIYKFEVKEGRESDFIANWRTLTILTRKHEGSYGSRLHHLSDNIYMAYALWPDKEKWERSGEDMTEEAKKSRLAMRDACINVETLYGLNVVDDQLMSMPEILR